MDFSEVAVESGMETIPVISYHPVDQIDYVVGELEVGREWDLRHFYFYPQNIQNGRVTSVRMSSRREKDENRSPDENMVEIGGQLLTQAQFDAARAPLLNAKDVDPGEDGVGDLSVELDTESRADRNEAAINIYIDKPVGRCRYCGS